MVRESPTAPIVSTGVLLAARVAASGRAKTPQKYSRPAPAAIA
jgi:hypothetical protein